MHGVTKVQMAQKEDAEVFQALRSLVARLLGNTSVCQGWKHDRCGGEGRVVASGVGARAVATFRVAMANASGVDCVWVPDGCARDLVHNRHERDGGARGTRRW